MHLQRPRFSWADCKHPDILALTAATQLPADRPVAHHSSLTEPSWLPRQNSFDSGYSKCSSHDASEHGSFEFTDDYHLARHGLVDVSQVVPCQNSFCPGYSKCSSHGDSQNGSSEFTDYHLAPRGPMDVPEAVVSHHTDSVRPSEEPMSLGRWLLLLGRRARQASGYF
ncbi:hypothetical protein K503DRAFT_536445 [Rhizopogon vinicolor AM-OR11-026]|uniref:Uncharacterized protein n=1 Tax=Rhizopogon vinicolor AM-OR11-026 TaxID=1314800 RepID=A0A1B7N8G1_9AGAM|nr:hypothetical protein K503DRAFT_536445 [Rhizopogon vinicolor AM-OR11-026]